LFALGVYLWLLLYKGVTPRRLIIDGVCFVGGLIETLWPLRTKRAGRPWICQSQPDRWNPERVKRCLGHLRNRHSLLQSLLSSTRASSIGDGALAPIPTQMIHQLLADLQLDGLSLHRTTIDTTVVTKDVDKGTGLVAIRDWILEKDAETIAIGDGEPDLAMFRVATRSFAPANIGPGRQARLLGCQIASSPGQQGLLEIVRTVLHAVQEELRAVPVRREVSA
jgi:hypothetical protein